MKSLSALLLALGETTKTNRKVELLKEYFLHTSGTDRDWGLFILAGGVLPRSVTSRQIREWSAESAQVPLWLFEESYHVVGDLAETVALLIEAARRNGAAVVGAAVNDTAVNDTAVNDTAVNAAAVGSIEVDSVAVERANGASAGPESLTEYVDWLRGIARLEPLDKQQVVQGAWRAIPKENLFLFGKLLTGSLRVGVSRALVVRALAQMSQLDEAIIAHRLTGELRPETVSFERAVKVNDEHEVNLRPYPFALAHPLAADPQDLGVVEEWIAEWKWDGIRSELILRGGELLVFSRGEEVLTDRFPEFEPLKALVDEGAVIDGEIVAWLPGTRYPAAFSLLQKRITRKKLSKAILEEAPVRVLAYDLLELGGIDLRREPLEVRREKLRRLVARMESPVLELSSQLQFSTWDELTELQARAAEFGAEGVMLKRKSSAYHVGRKRGDWWKWKLEPLVFDGVLIYAQKGHGRRADMYTDYTFGVWDGERLVTVAKAYSGLTDAEMKEVDSFVKKHTEDKFGPVRTVTPELVFEIAFEGIQASARHKSGIALRFPRISRWRRDKAAAEADSLETLQALLRARGSQRSG